jgi:hypothetical protein
MTVQTWEFTIICVMEGKSREEAFKGALQYLAEYAAKGELEYSGAELIEERGEA